MIIVEDAQHLDEASQDLFVRLSKAAAERRQVLIVTREGADAVFASDDGAPSFIVDLGPLAIEALTAMLRSATDDDPLRPHEIEELARRSGGNPLFLFQLLDMVRSTGTMGALPDSIESLIAGEIDQLAPTDRTVLRYASVLGTSFDPGLLVDCVRDELDMDTDVWSRLGQMLIRESNGELRFRSTLIRDAAYEGLPYRRRRVLHGRVGEAIEASAGVSLDEEVGVLAVHYHEAQRWDKAWRFCRQAGDRAMAVYANVEATRFYDKALDAGRRQRSVTAAELAGLYEQSADARYRLGEFDAADHGFKAARRLLNNDPIKAAPLVVKQAMIATRTADYRRALVQVRRALRTLEGRTGQEAAANRARLLVPIAAVKYWQNRRVESIEWSRRAIHEARRGKARDALAEAYKFLDLALWENGQVEKATHSGEALAIYVELGDLRNQALILNNLGAFAHESSNWDEARGFFERGLAIAEQIGDRSVDALMKYNLCEILIDQGRYDEAEPLIREVIRVWRASGAEGDVAEGQRELARLLARRGDIVGARPLLEQSRAYQSHAGKQGEALRTDARIAEMLLLAGEGDQVLKVIEAAEHLAAVTDGGSVLEPTLARLRGWAYCRTGHPAEAERALDRALRLARRRGDLHEEALTLDAILALGPATQRLRNDLERARDDLFERLGIIEPPRFPAYAKQARTQSPRRPCS